MQSEDSGTLETDAGAVLFALDVDKLAAFYLCALEFREAARGGNYRVLRRMGFELIVHAVPAAVAGRIGDAAPTQRRSDAAIKLGFAVSDLASLRERVAVCGGLLDPPEREWSLADVRVVDGVDPEGNVFQLRQRPCRQEERQVPTWKLDYLAPVFRVADLDRALAYYRERLGFETEFVHHGFYAGVERDGCRIQLKHEPSMPSSPAVVAASDRIDACFGVRDAVALAADFAKAGADFAVSLHAMPYGKEFYLRDVDGHVLAFVEAAVRA